MRGKAITGATAVLILAFFFLPWVSVSYNGRGLGQFSGYQLAVGAGGYALDGLNGRSPLFFVPLSALMMLLWGVVAHIKPSWRVLAATGAVVTALSGLLVLLWQMLASVENSLLVFVPELGLWLTLLSFLFSLLGAMMIFREIWQEKAHPRELVPELDDDVVGKTAVIPLPDDLLHTLTKNASVENANVTAVSKIWLMVVDGEMVGERFLIIPPARIGRDPGNDIVIDDSSMSGYHAVVREQGGAYHVQDLNSTNGIYLENQTQHQWQRVPAVTLVDDMHIKLGRTIFQVIAEE